MRSPLRDFRESRIGKPGVLTPDSHCFSDFLCFRMTLLIDPGFGYTYGQLANTGNHAYALRNTDRSTRVKDVKQV